MEPAPNLDKELIQHCINFHGHQLQKIWDSERGDGDLAKNGGIDFDFSVYQERQKHLGFQDRGKRLQIQHFIARRADQLFDVANLSGSRAPLQLGKPLTPGEDDFYAILPPYDTFLPLDKSNRIQHFYKCVQPGDLLICSITSKGPSGMMLKVLCTDSSPFRFVADLNIKAFCPASQMPPAGVVTDKKGVSRAVMHNEAVRVELLEVVPDSEKMVVSMLQSPNPDGVDDALKDTTNKSPLLGLVYTEDLPTAYKKCQEHKSETYSILLEQSLGFANPSNTELLTSKAGISNDTSTSFMKSLRGRFPMEEYSQELRHNQASKWAFKSVAEGITHFKANRHSEAFQCLNRALSIDRRNVEGLVARGALYANSGSFQKAIEDFESALKLNPNHQNARKYMGETLVALGRSYEDENNMEEALKSYEKCLTLVPYHEEAQSSIRYLENKMRTGGSALGSASVSKLSQDPQAVNPTSTDDLIPGGLSAKSGLEMKATLKQLLKAEQEEKGRSSRSKKKKDRKRKSKRSRKHRRRDHSSSSSTSSSTASASSSSSSSSSSGSGSSGDRGSSRSASGSPRRGSKHRKAKKHHLKEAHREKSLSPLSKRMALMETSHDSDGLTGLSGLMTGRMASYGSSSVPYSFDESAAVVKPPPVSAPQSKETDYEQQVRKKKKSKDEEKRRKRRSRKSGQSDLGEGSGAALVDQLGSFDEGGHRIMKEALLAKQLAAMSKRRRQASESSSDDQEDTGAGMLFPHKKHHRDKSTDLSRMLEEMPDLDDRDLESKLKNYWSKLDKDKHLSKKSDEKEKKAMARTLVTYPSPIGKKSVGNNNVGMGALSPKNQYHSMDLEDNDEDKQMDIFADSPPSKSKMGMNEPSNIVSSKWKMQITPNNNKVKKREHSEKEPWEEVEDKRVAMYSYGKEEGEASSGGEVEPRRRSSRRGDEGGRPKESPAHVLKTDAYYEKFGGFRVARKDDPSKMDPSSILPAKAPPTPVPAPGKDSMKGLRADSDSELDPKKKMMRKSRSRSKSSVSSRSRARSTGSSVSAKRRRSRSRSYRPRSRSGSYRYGSRSRSRSYYSRSRSRSRSYDRSRSRSYYSRSRSGSREGGRRRSSDYYKRGSRSPDRYRRYDNQRNMHRYPRQRGTYYRPRFQNYNKNPRGGFVHRGRGFIPRGNRPFVHRGRGRGRPRYFHYGPNRPGGYRPDHHRRYSDSRERSRNSEDRRSYEERDRDREGGERDRDRDRERDRSRREEDRKSVEGGRKRDREDMSENEHHDDGEYMNNKPPSDVDYIDRKMFEGKWAEDRDEEKRRSEGSRRIDDDGLPPPPGTTDLLHEKLEDTDHFLDKVKGPKKDDLKMKNKSPHYQAFD
ncbi:hypothetical protein B566_EDAN009745 [Ephemera danica]|nr:hypothetical protein B566_EDAN009745 [Ephemera danica]